MEPALWILVAKLERLRLVESTSTDSRLPMYRLTILGRVAAGSTSILKGSPA
jgi:hypothetical protein